MRTILLATTTLLLTLLPLPAHAQVPDVIDFQARISDAGGPMNGNVSLVLRMYTNASPVGGEAVILEDSNTVTAVDGLVSTFIGDDLGPTQHITNAVRHSPLYVEMQANGTVLSPRMRVTAVAYAVRAGSVATGTISADHLIDGTVTSDKLAPAAKGWTDSGSTVHLTYPLDNVVIGYTAFARGKLYVEATDNGVVSDAQQDYGVFGKAYRHYGVYGSAGNYGVYGNVTHNFGVHGIAGVNNGVLGSAQNFGVYGYADQTRGVYGRGQQNFGVFGYTPANFGVWGQAGVNYGVHGSAQNFGVYGNAGNYGVYGNALDYGVRGNASGNNGVHGSAQNYGVYGYAQQYRGVYGRAQQNLGVYGYAAGNFGVWGQAGGNYGVHGIAGNHGLHGNASTDNAVSASATRNYGVYGEAQNYGVYGRAHAGNGVCGVSATTNGVFGFAIDYGVVGSAADDYGVFGKALNSYGVYGKASGNYAVYGNAGGYYGAYGKAQQFGVYGHATDVMGVYGYGYNDFGGYFSSSFGNAIGCSGDIVLYGSNVRHHNGALKAFTIDHPLDPCNRVLRHFSYEGPEARVVYEGEATLGDDGSASVELPAYFESLGRTPRIQLTPVNASMPNVFCTDVTDGTFAIKAGHPKGRVYWQVTAERDDPKARLERVARPVEDEKGRAGLPAKGEYISPECY